MKNSNESFRYFKIFVGILFCLILFYVLFYLLVFYFHGTFSDVLNFTQRLLNSNRNYALCMERPENYTESSQRRFDLYCILYKTVDFSWNDECIV